MLAPQSPDPFVVDMLGLIEQGMHAPVAVARMLGGQALHLRHGLRVVLGWAAERKVERCKRSKAQARVTERPPPIRNSTACRLSATLSPFFPRAP